MLITKDTGIAANFLKAGNLVAIPTETVYGLAGNALDPDVVLKIFEVKQRPSFDPLILHLPSLPAARFYVQEISPMAMKLAGSCWPGPLTLLLPKKKTIPDLVTSGSDWVGIRVPAHPLTLELLRKLDFPLAARIRLGTLVRLLLRM